MSVESQCLSFDDWLLPHSLIYSRFIYVITHVRVSSLFKVELIICSFMLVKT